MLTGPSFFLIKINIAQASLGHQFLAACDCNFSFSLWTKTLQQEGHKTTDKCTTLVNGSQLSLAQSRPVCIFEGFSYKVSAAWSHCLTAVCGHHYMGDIQHWALLCRRPGTLRPEHCFSLDGLSTPLW